MNRRLLSLSIALTITVSGCAMTTECDCFVFPWALFVSGTVTQNNAPIPGRIMVDTRVFEGDCSASDSLALDMESPPLPADAQGRFSIEVHASKEVTSGCIRLRVLRANSEVGKKPDTLLVVQRTGIRVRRASNDRPVDSLTVALAVP
jgi:hypothetical protein